MMNMGDMRSLQIPNTHSPYARTKKNGALRKKPHCSYCKNHDVMSSTRQHNCPFKDKCKCILCVLTEKAQVIMCHQQRVWRFQNQKLMLKLVNEQGPGQKNPMHGQKCDNCRNHSEFVKKSNHECPYIDCQCKLCKLTAKRRIIMKYIQRARRLEVTVDSDIKIETGDSEEINLTDNEFGMSEMQNISSKSAIESPTVVSEDPFYWTSSLSLNDRKSSRKRNFTDYSFPQNNGLSGLQEASAFDRYPHNHQISENGGNVFIKRETPSPGEILTGAYDGVPHYLKRLQENYGEAERSAFNYERYIRSLENKTPTDENLMNPFITSTEMRQNEDRPPMGILESYLHSQKQREEALRHSASASAFSYFKGLSPHSLSSTESYPRVNYFKDRSPQSISPTESYSRVSYFNDFSPQSLSPTQSYDLSETSDEISNRSLESPEVLIQNRSARNSTGGSTPEKPFPLTPCPKYPTFSYIDNYKSANLPLRKPSFLGYLPENENSFNLGSFCEAIDQPLNLSDRSRNSQELPEQPMEITKQLLDKHLLFNNREIPFPSRQMQDFLKCQYLLLLSNMREMNAV